MESMLLKSEKTKKVKQVADQECRLQTTTTNQLRVYKSLSIEKLHDIWTQTVFLFFLKILGGGD